MWNCIIEKIYKLSYVRMTNLFSQAFSAFFHPGEALAISGESGCDVHHSWQSNTQWLYYTELPGGELCSLVCAG